ncbi:MAG: SUMF1/EgtB/PvdO family nonheme iron enzyme [Proteobacteria bacterium]|nr:SUMF1/EgtB/PvdO family nonheme iron enzyme [Pseudomonadota bacterium]
MQTDNRLLRSLKVSGKLAVCLVLGYQLILTNASALDTISISRKIAESLAYVNDPRYATVAFSRILGDLDLGTVNELIDFTNVALVRGRKFRVIDRSKLQLILKEQQFNVSGMVSHNTYKELGKLLGVDLFIYGKYYRDTLVLKAIDVESSAIIWSDIFRLKDPTKHTRAIYDLSEKMMPSIRNDVKRLKSNKIQQISFWNIKSVFESDQIIDFLSVAITKDQNFQVVDRESLSLLLEEQKLSLEDFIDQSKAKKMGELYGIDAFFYGSITKKQGQYIASLKLLNIYNGVIEWADLISFGNSDAHKSSKVSSAKSSSDSNDAEMVLIPSGAIMMGTNSGPPVSWPAFKMPVRAYFMDRYEVSNGEYYKFVKKFNHRPPPSWKGKVVPREIEDKPVVMVSWEDANRYCKSQYKRLPKESEWEKAFRGPNNNLYPWSGDRFQVGAARTIESGILKSLDVQSSNKDVSHYGVHHMAGNVREWMSNFLRPYPGSRYFSSKVGRNRVIRGGSWAQTKKSAVGWARASSKQTYAWKDVGFRCVKKAN